MKNESAAYNLHSIGAVDFFNALRVDLTPELERRIDEILENILSQSNLSRSSSSMNIIFLFTLSLRPKNYNLGNKVFKRNLFVLVRTDAFTPQV